MEQPWNRLRFALCFCAWLVGGGSSVLAGAGISLSLVWSASSDPSVAGYRVHYGEGSRQYTRKLDARNSASVEVPNLTPGTTYYFAVTAYNGHDVESHPSNEISVTTPGVAPGLYSGLFSAADALNPGQAGSLRLPLSAALGAGNSWPLFVPSSAGQGLLAGWLSFKTETNSDIGGTITWIKPPDPKSAYESGGVTNVSEVLGSAYVAGPHRAVLFGERPNFEALFGGGDLANDFAKSCVMRSASQAVGSSANDFAMNFSTATGMFRGKVADPTSGLDYAFAGAVLQKLNFGSGFVLVPGHSGRMVLTP